MTALETIAWAVGIASTGAGAYVYDLSQRDDQHNELRAEYAAANVELDLQRVELELKFLRTIEERRPLTPDELDRRAYLEALRAVLIAEQRS